MGNFLKGAKVFTGTLFFGSDESQGLIRTLGSASLEAGKNFGAAMLNNISKDSSSNLTLDDSSNPSCENYDPYLDQHFYYDREKDKWIEEK